MAALRRHLIYLPGDMVTLADPDTLGGGTYVHISTGKDPGYRFPVLKPVPMDGITPEPLNYPPHMRMIAKTKTPDQKVVALVISNTVEG